MMAKRPTVSVALCTYNGEKHLEQQLNSIINQSYPASEIVICDDGSVDDTLNIVREFEKQNPGLFHIIKNSTQVGARRNFESAIKLCSGDVICLCDQDDIWLPYKIEKQVGFLIQNSYANAVFSNGSIVSEAGVEFGETIWEAVHFDSPIRDSITRENLLKYLLINGNVATGTTTAIRGKAKDEILPFQFMDEMWHDHWIALKFSASKSFSFIDEPLLLYRSHDMQQVGLKPADERDPEFKLAVYETWQIDSRAVNWHRVVTHLAWAVQRLQRYKERLKSDNPIFSHVDETGRQIVLEFEHAKRQYLRTFPFLSKKKKLFKHWLRGGEYLRITFKDVCII